MKKALYFMFACLMCIALIGCKKNKPVEPINFEACYMADYNEMLADNPDTTFRFYFAQAWLNQNIDEVSCMDSVAIDSVKVLFQADENTIITFTHFQDGSIVKDTIEGIWLECMVIDPANVCDNLMTMVEKVSKMDCIKPHSNIVVMRCPLAPPFNEHPYYLFGTPLQYMSINSCDETNLLYVDEEKVECDDSEDTL